MLAKGRFFAIVFPRLTRLGEAEGKRADERHGQHVFARHFLAFNLGLAFDLIVLGGLRIVLLLPFAQTRSSAVEDVGRRGFRKKEEEKDEGRSGKPDDDPYRPGPALELCCPVTDDGADGLEKQSQLMVRVKETERHTGPMTLEIPKIAKGYARFAGEYMSAIEAPPVASTGLPKNPVRKRKARSMPMFFA